MNPWKNKNKKSIDARVVASDAAPCIGLRCSTLLVASVLHSLEVVFMRLYIGVLILSRLKLIAKSCLDMESQKIESTNLDQSKINRYNWGIVGLAHKWLHRAASRKKNYILQWDKYFNNLEIDYVEIAMEWTKTKNLTPKKKGDLTNQIFFKGRLIELIVNTCPQNTTWCYFDVQQPT